MQLFGAENFKITWHINPHTHIYGPISLLCITDILAANVHACNIDIVLQHCQELQEKLCINCQLQLPWLTTLLQRNGTNVWL